MPFTHEKLTVSPYINHFLQPDSNIPHPANPQSLNRFGYVLNNPIRFNDPTGHVCSDPDDPNRSCENSESYPRNAHPLGSGRLNITGGPLDDGFEQERSNHNNGEEDDDCDLDCELNMGGGHPVPLLDSSDITPGLLSLPPSPFACGWFDCALSVIGWVASMFTLTEIPEIVAVAFVVDMTVTGIALYRTEADYRQGRIDNGYRLSLHTTAVLGIVPGPVGAGFSFMNMIITLSGYPSLD